MRLEATDRLLVQQLGQRATIPVYAAIKDMAMIKLSGVFVS